MTFLFLYCEIPEAENRNEEHQIRRFHSTRLATFEDGDYEFRRGRVWVMGISQFRVSGDAGEGISLSPAFFAYSVQPVPVMICGYRGLNPNTFQECFRRILSDLWSRF